MSKDKGMTLWELIDREPGVMACIVLMFCITIVTSGCVSCHLIDRHYENREMEQAPEQLPVDTGSDPDGSSNVLRRGDAGGFASSERWPEPFLDRSDDPKVSFLDRCLIEIAAGRDVDRHRVPSYYRSY